MSKKTVKKTKVKLLNLLIVLIVLVGLFFGVKLLLDVNTKNIIITGTSYLNDDYIIEMAGIKDYPKFLLVNSRDVCKKVNSSKYISKCKVRKRWGFVLELELVENRALFFDSNKNKYVLDNNEEADSEDVIGNFRVPRLINYVPDKKYEKFITGMSNIDKNTLSKIGDIEYLPNDYDKDRFLLYMDDGNMVYLTLTKFKMINRYNDVLPQIGGHKGILYLDSGNHFKIME